MKIFLAPMVGRTDKYFRKLVRIISPNIVLFTEMITVDSLLRGRFKEYKIKDTEHPVVVQLAGSDKKKFIQCAEIISDQGFDEINLNIGCPSSKVVKGGFGACQIESPLKVAEYVDAIKSHTKIPISIKTRLGLGYEHDLKKIEEFITQTSNAGCGTYYIHARNAILNGISTRKNRSIPKLRYDDVLKLKKIFPDIKMFINGGIEEIDQIEEMLDIYNGVMIGRKIYNNPMFLAEIENKIFQNPKVFSIEDIICEYIDELDADDARNKLYALKHLTNLYKGTRLSKKWRKYLYNLINSNEPIYNLKNFYIENYHEEKKETIC
jgi:tRNA-dihydrouridine synthase A